MAETQWEKAHRLYREAERLWREEAKLRKKEAECWMKTSKHLTTAADFHMARAIHTSNFTQGTKEAFGRVAK